MPSLCYLKKFWIKDEVFLLNAYSQYYCLIEKSFLFAYERKVFIDTISVVIWICTKYSNSNNTRFQKKKFKVFQSLEPKIDWLLQSRIEKKFRSVTLLFVEDPKKMWKNTTGQCMLNWWSYLWFHPYLYKIGLGQAGEGCTFLDHRLRGPCFFFQPKKTISN